MRGARSLVCHPLTRSSDWRRQQQVMHALIAPLDQVKKAPTAKVETLQQQISSLQELDRFRHHAMASRVATPAVGAAVPWHGRKSALGAASGLW